MARSVRTHHAAIYQKRGRLHRKLLRLRQNGQNPILRAGTMAQLSIEQTFELAMQHLRAGRIAQAEPLVRQVLAQSPEHTDAMRCLAAIASQQQRNVEAIELLRRVVELEPDYAEAHYDLGIVLRDNGQLDAAISEFRHAVALDADFAEALLNLSIALRASGQLDQAITVARQLVALTPDVLTAHGNLAILLQQTGRFDDAVAEFRQVLALKPDDAGTHYNLGNALKDSGKLDEAIAACRQAIKFDPRFPAARNNLGSALMDQKQFDAAIAAYHEAVAIAPGDAEARSNLGKALNAKGLLAEAADAFGQATILNPKSADAFSNLGAVLKGLGQIDEAVAAYRQAGHLDPPNVKIDDDLLYALLFHPAWDAPSIAAEHRDWHRRRAEPLAKLIQPHPNDPNPDRRLRIGYVSPDFRDHVVGRNIIPLFRQHDRQGFEIFCYSQVNRTDAITSEYQRLADGWHNCVGESDDQVADQIRKDKIDILVDLALHLVNNRLLVFARKPAPVQVTFAGYPGSTGLTAIDYRLSDPYLDPPEMDESIYSEKTVHLPDSFWCYDPLDSADIAINPLPALGSGVLTFGCLNTSGKVNNNVLALWAKVLGQVENSRLLLMAPIGIHRSRIMEHFQKEGIGGGRIEFVALQSRRNYLETYHRIDLGLDTFPYNGHTTSLDSLWMGVPVISLVGNRVVGRAGWCQSSNPGLPELAALTPEQFVHISAGLAGDLPRLDALRSTLRRRMEQSPLMDAPKFARSIEAAYRRMWRTWCKAAPVGNQ